jgi:hypothetical protein
MFSYFVLSNALVLIQFSDAVLYTIRQTKVSFAIYIFGKVSKFAVSTKLS